MLTVILGAGASYDSAAILDQRPPLAAELYSTGRPDTLSVLQEIRAAGSIVQRMRNQTLSGGAVERALGDFARMAIETDNAHYKSDLIAMRFYLREIVRRAEAEVMRRTSGQTNQLALVTALHDWCIKYDEHVAFISFNYDTILESAISDRFGWKFDTTDNYLESPFPVIKPHGSANWIEELPLARPSTTAVFYDSPKQIPQAADWVTSQQGAVTIRDNNRANVGHSDTKLYVPAVAIPADYKDSFVLPDQHLNKLKDILEATRSLLMIGWRASEFAFLEICQKHLFSYRQGLRTHVVDYSVDPNTAGAEAIMDFPHALHRMTGVSHQGFSNFVASDELRNSLPIGTQ